MKVSERENYWRPEKIESWHLKTEKDKQSVISQEALWNTVTSCSDNINWQVLQSVMESVQLEWMKGDKPNPELFWHMWLLYIMMIFSFVINKMVSQPKQMHTRSVIYIYTLGVDKWS